MLLKDAIGKGTFQNLEVIEKKMMPSPATDNEKLLSPNMTPLP